MLDLTTMEGLKEALLSIELVGYRSDYGADEYVCPGCGQSVEISGHSMHMTPFNEQLALPHRKDCPLAEIRRKPCATQGCTDTANYRETLCYNCRQRDCLTRHPELDR